MQNLFRNVHYATRTSRESLGLTLTILLTLALGIGANTAIFSAAYATLLAPLPYPHPDQLVNVWSKIQGHPDGVSVGDFSDWKRQSTAFSDLNIGSTDNFNVATKDRPEFIDGMIATPGYYGMLGNRLFLGRNFRPEEGERGKNHVVMLTHRLWQHLGANHQIVGQTMRINDDTYTVVGVFEPGAPDRWDWQLFVPMVLKPEQLNDHASRYWLATGRLKPGITIEQAQAEMGAIMAREAKEYPKSNQGWGAIVEPYEDYFLRSDRKLTLWLLLGAVGFLLLIACLNVANLLLAKGIHRQREVVIRGALGAEPAAIFAQFLTEGLMLAIVAGAIGVAAGYGMLRGLIEVMPPGALPPEADLRMKIPILLVMLAVATLAGVLFGCAPAWYASRVDPAEVLKEGGRAGVGVGRHRLRRFLIVGEFALSLTLLTGAGLSMHSFWNLSHVDLGVRTDHIFTFYVDSLPLLNDSNVMKTSSYFRSILANIRAIPGVSQVCALSRLPLDGLHDEIPFSIAGKPASANPSLRPSADLEMVTPDYFQTFGVRIVRGRAFTDADNGSSVRVAMVNETFARKFLNGYDPLQQRVVMEQFGDEHKRGLATEWQIVGVFHTVRSRGPREDRPEIDTPFWQEAFPVSAVAVRTAKDPSAMIDSIGAAVNSVDPRAALYKTRTMDQVHNEVVANDRFTLILFASFAMVALLLATVGIYGVMAFQVTQRSNEIALRMALGASRNGVIALVVKDGMALAGSGLGLGLISAYFVARAMRSLLFEVPTIDLSVVSAVGLLLILAGLLACCLSALRAASADKMQLLKSE